ncbi:MAG: UDP-N-acetylmuramate--L-alanine ligase [Proteobacteria bacterium]|nr:UDP-N-acetylmuramate--L-alanine ligase [Pseudomonadota bacterium]
MKVMGKDVKGQKFHLIGVGGIGMRSIAEILARAGAVVSGSDSGAKGDYARLEGLGVTVFKGHDAGQVPDGAVVIVSSAVKGDNVELADARKRGLVVMHRAEVLAEIAGAYKCIAVSGTHGKTSTTGLIYAALKAAGVPVGVVIGGVLAEEGSTVVLPPKEGQWLVVEADESDKSFLKFKPAVAVVTNIEPEHMENYGSEEKLVEAFAEFAARADVAVVCADDPNAMIMASRLGEEVVTYGLEDSADVYASMWAPQGAGMAFDASLRGGSLPDVVVALPGVHYVANALAALAVAQIVKADVVKAAEGLAHFKGVGRRFTRVGAFHGAEVIDDYGHHPTEIATTLEAAKAMAKGKVVAVIEPHRYTRLRDTMEAFATCAKVADAAVVLPVYSAGEEPIAGVSHEVLGEKMNAAGLPPEVFVVDGEKGVIKALHTLGVGEGDMIVCLGAGDVTKVAAHLAEHVH